MKDCSKSFSRYRMEPSSEAPSSCLAITLGLTCFEPEVKLLWFVAVAGTTWSQCCCASLYKAPLV